MNVVEKVTLLDKKFIEATQEGCTCLKGKFPNDICNWCKMGIGIEAINKISTQVLSDIGTDIKC